MRRQCLSIVESVTAMHGLSLSPADAVRTGIAVRMAGVVRADNGASRREGVLSRISRDPVEEGSVRRAITSDSMAGHAGRTEPALRSKALRTKAPGAQRPGPLFVDRS